MPAYAGSLRYCKRISFFVLVACFLASGCSILGKKSEPGKAASKNPCIVLALPESGPFAAISSKIRKGARESQQELAKTGINVRIKNINTESPSWLTNLGALPEECAVVGGPMRENSYLAAEKAGALERRAFFAFMPTLKAAEEGKRAWRFFPSPHDQINALVNFVVDDLDIHSFGAFYPSDSYGTRMTKMLETRLASKNMTLHKASYNPRESSTWAKSSEILVKPVVAPGKSPIPQTAFEAVLLPDSWKNIDKLTASFLVNGEDRLVLMGTTLWEQSLSGKQIPKAQNYALAVFPGAWNSARAPKNLQGPENDFWTALGYDFIRFASHIGLNKRLNASEVSTAARNAASSMRALAPISYDGNGIAHQKLYLFQVSSTGMKPMNVEEFRNKRKHILQDAALRKQQIQSEPAHVIEEPAETNEAPAIEPARTNAYSEPVHQAEPVQAPQQTKQPLLIQPMAPQAPAQAPLSTTPQPSYKLRLPAKR